MWFAWRFVPYNPARHWIATIVSQVLPALLWLVLLLVFWKETTPASNRLTRPVAAVLCFLTGVIGVRGSYLLAERLRRGVMPTGEALWGVIVRHAAYTLGWVSLAVLLLAIYKRYGRRADVPDMQGLPQ